MKRVSIDIDLKDNEIFDKEVTEIIKAKVREIVRNDFSDIVGDAVKDELNRLIDGTGYTYREKLEKELKRAALPKVRDVIGDMDVNQLISDKVKELVEAKMNWYVDESTKQCRLTLNEIVTKEAVEKIKSVLC
ncbi:hypothetical protein [Robinsoniella peoriensis]|uniref:hypothetical protein n=1 Tax=Robinsoniella peoriensis TaxID=180332 RepID=UPI00085CCF0E|nr:hypothetical protein [Robinsoniella peoriensis]